MHDQPAARRPSTSPATTDPPGSVLTRSPRRPRQPTHPEHLAPASTLPARQRRSGRHTQPASTAGLLRSAAATEKIQMGSLRRRRPLSRTGEHGYGPMKAIKQEPIDVGKVITRSTGSLMRPGASG